MATTQRIYTVGPAVTEAGAPDTRRLVRAPNAAQALRHVAADTLKVSVATQDDIATLVAAGAKVEPSGEAALREAAASDRQQALPTT